MDNLAIYYHFDVLRDLRDDMIDPVAIAALDFVIDLYDNDKLNKEYQQYILYEDEKFIAQGTLEELSKLTGLKSETIRFYSSPSNLKRIDEIKKKGKKHARSKFYVATKVFNYNDD